MPKSQSRKSASAKRLTQTNDLLSGLGRVASDRSDLRQKSKVRYQQGGLLSAAQIECSKVLYQPFFLIPFINTGCLKLKLKRKTIDDGAEPPAKKRTWAQRDDMPLPKVRISNEFY
jgi:hypothetical protein